MSSVFGSRDVEVEFLDPGKSESSRDVEVEFLDPGKSESVELTNFGQLTERKFRDGLDNGSGEEELTDQEKEDEKTLISSEDSIDCDGVVREYETALKYVGFGPFHILLLIINGFALSSDAVEVLSISFVLPVLVRPEEFGVNDAAEAVLGSIIFVGMLFGSYIWGGLADVIGRRTTLVSSLAVSAIFGILSAFSPWFWLFVVLRFFSGFGVGGSLPVIFPYTSEFIRNKYRGPYMGIQSIFWMLGRFVCGGFAWAIIPRTEINFTMGSLLEFHSWRLFIIISAIPSLVGCILYFFLPESPRFLLEVGKQDKAMKVLRFAYRLNHLTRKEEYPVKSILLAGIKSNHHGWVKGSSRRLKSLIMRCREVVGKTIEIFSVKYVRRSLLLLIVMFCLSFGGYGIALWYPTYINEIHTTREREEHIRFCNASVVLSASESIWPYCGCSNTIFSNSTVRDIQLHDWKINDVIFEDVSFINVRFTSVAFNATEFSNCEFLNCTFTQTLFNRTDFNMVLFDCVNISFSSLHDLTGSFITVKENSVKMKNVDINDDVVSESFNASTFEDILNQDRDYAVVRKYKAINCKPDDSNVYRDNFIISASSLPGHIASAFAVYFLPRNYWLGTMLLASTVSVFLLFWVTSETFVVVILCIFTVLTTPAWNDSSLIIAEVYPTHLRSSAAGIHLLMARIGAIIGTNIFGLFIRVNPSVPILLVASILFVGGVVSFLLPKTTRKTLLK